MAEVYLIKNTKRYFISSEGYVFKTQGIREIEIPINIIQGIPRVKVGNERLNLALLMIEYFHKNELDPFDKYTFKIKNNRLLLKDIKLIKAGDFSSEDEKNIFMYKCKQKASSQNYRSGSNYTISEYDILNALKRTDFNCFYCGTKIKPKHFHIDHVQPLSESGKNIAQNLAASCKYCNLMKGAISLDKFLHQIKLINKNLLT